MDWLTTAIRSFSKWQFRVRGLSTIPEISAVDFPAVLSDLKSQGWVEVWRSIGIDPDYDCIRMWRNGRMIKCEWDVWHEWSISGNARVVRKIAERTGRNTSDEWRWAVWDD